MPLHYRSVPPRGGSHGSQTPHRPQLLRSRPSDANPTPPKPASKLGVSSSTAISNWSRSSAATTPAPVARGGGFKNCCLQSGHYDGIHRDHYF